MKLFEEGLELFGLNIISPSTKENPSAALAAPLDDDGAAYSYATGAANLGVYLDIDSTFKSEFQAIQKYREVSLFAEVDLAIQDIVNEAIPMEHDTPLATLNMDDVEVTASVKKKFTEEFNTVLNLFDYRDQAADMFRRWYVDGRAAYQVIVDKDNTKDGIKQLIPLDALKIKKVKEITKTRTQMGVDAVAKVEEYFVFNDSGFVSTTGVGQHSGVSNTSLKINKDAIIYCSSGFIDTTTNTVLSYLNKAIRPINQLRMLEDATVIYFIARAPERRAFYIDVGNLPKLKAEQYMKDIMNRYRNKMVYDAKDGSVRNEKKHMCLAMDTLVPLLDGRTLTISQIAEEKEQGKTLWAYSCDPVTGKFVPGIISWAGVTRKDAQVVKLTLDNGKTIVCTPDHRFPVWGKGFTQAKDLVSGESMVPYYNRQKGLASQSAHYEQIFENSSKKWRFVHRIVSEWKDEHSIDNEFVFDESTINDDKQTVHHVNFNKFDNTPENLIRMNGKDHCKYHQSLVSFIDRSAGGKIGGARCRDEGLGYFNKNHPKYKEWHINSGKIGGAKSSELGRSQENYKKGREVLKELMQDKEWNQFFRQRQSEGWGEESRKLTSIRAKETNLSAKGNEALSLLWNDEDWKLKRRNKYAVAYDESMFEIVIDCIKSGLTKAETSDVLNSKTEILSSWKELNTNKVINSPQKNFESFTFRDVSRIAEQYGNCSFKELSEQIKFRNHKIVSVEWMESRIDTGCLTIDENEVYHNYHTFALDAGIYTKNSMLEDYWLPRRDSSKGTQIESLPGAQNVQGYLDSLDWFKDKMYEALCVPKSRMQGESGFSMGRSSEITRDELKFQKFINRLKSKFSSLLLDALRTQLILKQICSVEEWDELKHNIKVNLQTDNYFEEFKEQDIMQSRIAMLPQIDPYLQKYFSKEYVQKKILRMSDDEIELEDKRMKDEETDPTAQPPNMMTGSQGSLPDLSGGQDMSQQPSQQDNSVQAPPAQSNAGTAPDEQ